jgi:P27 family predicted phage terminase small subunit
MRGRIPKPEVIHSLHGNPGKRKRKEGLTVVGSAPTPPTFLIPHAKRIWKELIADFGDINLVTPADKYTYGMMCQALARVIEGEKVLTKTGLIVEEPVINRHGNFTGQVKIKAHPMIAVVKMYSALANQIGARFGLSPGDRARITMPVPPADEDDDDGWQPNSDARDELTAYLEAQQK